MAEQLDADVDRYLQAGALNVAPPPIPSDPLVGGDTPIEQLLRVLGLAANSGDPQDSADSIGRHAERDVWTTEAAGSFAEQDDAAAQQLPQLISGITGALTGVAGALLQPISQLPQQLTQGAQQVIEAATALVGGLSSPDQSQAEDPGTDSAAESSTETMDFADMGDVQDPAGSADPTAVPVTAPTAALSPAPAASSATYPSGSSGVPSARVATTMPPSAPSATAAGMPMVPPAGMPMGGTDSRADSKTDTKRVVAVSNRRDGKPVAARPIRNETAVESA